MSAIPPTDRWIEFFNCYRRLPALWKASDEIYKNKRAKAAAYKKLLASYLKLDPDANVDSMRRRMNGIRTCYRRELRKVEQSELVAKNADDIYVPHLWYFKELSFLREDICGKEAFQASIEDTADSFFNDEDVDIEDESMEDIKENGDNFTTEETKIEQHIEPERESSLNNSFQSHKRPALDMALSHGQLLPPLTHANHNSRDEAMIYSEGWAISYRKLDQRNRLLAKKAIEEILVLGQLNQLEFNSVRMPH